MCGLDVPLQVKYLKFIRVIHFLPEFYTSWHSMNIHQDILIFN